MFFLILYLLLLGMIDLKWKKIPMVLILFGGGAAIAYKTYAVFVLLEPVADMISNALMGCLPGVMLLVIACVSKQAGYGDGLILMIVGIFEGFVNCILLWMGSLLLMAGVAGGLWIFHRVQKKTKMPYLPFLFIVYLMKIVTG